MRVDEVVGLEPDEAVEPLLGRVVEGRHDGAVDRIGERRSTGGELLTMTGDHDLRHAARVATTVGAAPRNHSRETLADTRPV
ncbi:hypothetical protein GCM10027515_13690 [Schumannella luteola]